MMTDYHRQLAESNIELVDRFLSRFRPPRYSYDDIRAELLLSLCRSSMKYDPKHEMTFKSFAWMNFRNVVISQYVRYSARMSKVPDLEALARLSDSKDIHYDEVLYHKDNQEWVEDAINTNLDATERYIITEHFGINEEQTAKTYKEIGSKIGLSKQAVHKRTLKSLYTLQEYAEKTGII